MLLEQARALAARGQWEQAEALFEAALARDAQLHEATLALVDRATARGDTRRAVTLLEAAVQAAPDTNVLLRLGLACRGANDLPRAIRAFEQVLQTNADNHRAWLYLGTTLVAAGDHPQATLTLYRAIRMARERGDWLHEESIEPALRGEVIYAMNYAAHGRRAWLAQSLESLRRQHGSAALDRVDKCIAGYLGEIAVASNDSRQQPRFLHFPDLPPQPWFAREQLPFLSALEHEFEPIRSEAVHVWQADALAPYLGSNTSAQAAEYLGGTSTQAAWDAFFFYRHGQRLDAHCTRCPRTTQALDSLPLVRIVDHAPEICFSVLRPGSHILPHRGLTNTRVVVHFPLLIPSHCSLTVAGEQRPWHEGECLIFDDTYEHEARNDATSDRIIVLMDAWNPHLTPLEREALAALIPEIGRFNRLWQSLAH